MCNGSALTAGEPRIIDNAGRRALPFNTESFEDIMQSHVYVDKTLLVRDVLDRRGVTLFCRPRRFGKSTAMRMLQCFFEVPVEGEIPDRRHLFDNLAVAELGERYMAECGKHPVIYLSFGSVGRQSIDASLGRMAMTIADEYMRHRYLLADGFLMSFERERFERIASGRATYPEFEASLEWLSKLLDRYHGSKTVILIDEYDVLVSDGYLFGYREEAVRFYRSWLTDALKGTTSLYLAALTGVLRVAQESIFSELNNVTVNTTLDERFDEAFGFTGEEAEALASYMGYGDRIDDMCSWYDGYRFGNARVYNPWSVLHFLDEGKAQPYWTNTSSNGIVRKLVAQADQKTTLELSALAAGEAVSKPIDLRTVFDDLDDNPGAVWAQMYQTGYVTTEDIGFPNDDEMLRELHMPNLEVARLFLKELVFRSTRIAGSESRLQALYRAVTGDDPAALETALGAIVLDSPSFHDLADEGRCHMLLLSLLYGVPGYRPPVSGEALVCSFRPSWGWFGRFRDQAQSPQLSALPSPSPEIVSNQPPVWTKATHQHFPNRESGTGRADILLEPLPERVGSLPAVVIEVKRPRTPAGDDLDAEALSANARDDALAQAQRNEYGHGLAGAGRILWGVSFSGKHVACACSVV